MALGSARSPSGLQPVLLSASQRHRRSKRQDDLEFSRIGSKIIMVFATIIAALTFVMGFTCTKIYTNYAPALGIMGLVKKAVFMIFLLCNSITMLTSVATVMNHIKIQHLRDCQMINEATKRAMELVALAFLSMLVAFVVGVFLVLILLPWHTFFHV
ncbi:hypothetical protein V5N11_030141 [Cardamine amara subsp. amara]|uniref:PGG domain-containing protein n=1 Tax=Cardamine amara subsp. amara TaxID=228776 RepID=A0ABD1BFR2_CARAN